MAALVIFSFFLRARGLRDAVLFLRLFFRPTFDRQERIALRALVRFLRFLRLFLVALLVDQDSKVRMRFR